MQARGMDVTERDGLVINETVADSCSGRIYKLYDDHLCMIVT